MAGVKSSIYLTDVIKRKLKVAPYGHRGTSEAVSATITRYDIIIRPAMREIKDLLTEEELTECINACISTDFSRLDLPDMVLMNVEDMKEECLYPENKSALEQKLRKLTIVQQIALIELIEATRESYNT